MSDYVYLADSFACLCPTPFPLHIIRAISFLTLVHETEVGSTAKGIHQRHLVLVGTESEFRLLKSEYVWSYIDVSQISEP